MRPFSPSPFLDRATLDRLRCAHEGYSDIRPAFSFFLATFSVPLLSSPFVSLPLLFSSRSSLLFLSSSLPLFVLQRYAAKKHSHWEVQQFMLHPTGSRGESGRAQAAAVGSQSLFSSPCLPCPLFAAFPRCSMVADGAVVNVHCAAQATANIRA